MTRIIRSLNRFEVVFANATATQKEEVVSVLRSFMAEARTVSCDLDFKRAMGAVRPELKKHCTTCALESSTDSLDGFAPTAYGFLSTIVNDRIFLCHSNQPGWRENDMDVEKVMLCRQYYPCYRLFLQ